jgi:hypothetical protein
MIECVNKNCKRSIEITRKIIWDVLQVEVYKMPYDGSNVLDYRIEIQCPYCDSIFAIPIKEYFEKKFAADKIRIDKIYESGKVKSE